MRIVDEATMCIRTPEGSLHLCLPVLHFLHDGLHCIHRLYHHCLLAYLCDLCDVGLQVSTCHNPLNMFAKILAIYLLVLPCGTLQCR